MKNDAKFEEEFISNLTWGIWWILTRALESLKNFHFNVLLLSKVYIVWAKKVPKSYLSWNWIGIQNLERNRLVVSRLAKGIWQILTWALESLKNFHFHGLLLHILFELKKYRGVISQDIAEWCRIWRKTDLLLRKWHEEFGKYSPEYSKVSKLELYGMEVVEWNKKWSLPFPCCLVSCQYPWKKTLIEKKILLSKVENVWA